MEREVRAQVIVLAIIMIVLHICVYFLHKWNFPILAYIGTGTIILLGVKLIIKILNNE